MIQPRQQKVDALLKFPPSKTRKQVQSLLGLAGYYRCFLPHYSNLTYPLTALLKKNTLFKWTEAADNAFTDLKSRLPSRPILKPPDYTKRFLIAVDALNTCLGAVFFLITDDLEHPVCFLSRKLRQAELHYSTVEKEALALVSAVRAFAVYFGATPVTVYTDHSPLCYIDSMRNHNQKLARWSMELQQYALTVLHRLGRSNLLPDLLRRLTA